MTRLVTQQSATLAAVLVFMTASLLSLQPSFSSGIARRDAVRSEQQHQQEAIKFAREAGAYGKQGHTEVLVTNVEAALQHALQAGKGPHVDAGVAELKHALEHGNAGHGDVATKHAEQAVTHLSEK